MTKTGTFWRNEADDHSGDAGRRIEDHSHGRREQTLQLIDAGNTIPFIARYRKEATGNLDDQVLREFAERLLVLRALEETRGEVLRLIDAQGQLTAGVDRQIDSARTLTELDDLYRPFRPKRRTRASIAREQRPAAAGRSAAVAAGGCGGPEAPGRTAGLGRNRMCLTQQPLLPAPWISWLNRPPMTPGSAAACASCCCRTACWKAKAKTDGDRRFMSRIINYAEPVSRIAGHRILAINRGEREKILTVKITMPPDRPLAIIRSWLIRRDSAATPWLLRVCEDAWKRLLRPRWKPKSATS